MTTNRHGSAVIEFPNDLEIVTTREFDAPIELVFNVLTKPEHVSKWFAPFACEVTECTIDLRVGGSFHTVFVSEDGTECSFRGTYLEVAPPNRIVQTWLFEGWPDADAVEYVDLHETDGVTKLTVQLAFHDKTGRDHMTTSDGQEDSFNKMEDYFEVTARSNGNCISLVEARAMSPTWLQASYPSSGPPDCCQSAAIIGSWESRGLLPR